MDVGPGLLAALLPSSYVYSQALTLPQSTRSATAALASRCAVTEGAALLPMS
ncbi:hypothetical protein CVCC1112_51 [Paenarthrobacter nicotinovorans]|nr:hypothetical protein CVCC1112_51 [Paenarthrobacter nicotinovorans]